MLDDRHGLVFREISDEVRGSIDVEEVIVGQLFALKDLGILQTARQALRTRIESRFLMGVLPITEVLDFLEDQGLLLALLFERSRDHRIIGRDRAEGLRRELPSELGL